MLMSIIWTVLFSFPPLMTHELLISFTDKQKAPKWVLFVCSVVGDYAAASVDPPSATSVTLTAFGPFGPSPTSN